MAGERSRSSSVGDELRRLSGAFVRGLRTGTLAYATCLWVLVLGSVLFDGSIVRDPLGSLGALIAAAIYLVATGALFGAVVGLLNVGRAMVGAWVVLPALAVALGLSLALGLGAELLASAARRSSRRSRRPPRRDSGWSAASVGPPTPGRWRW